MTRGYRRPSEAMLEARRNFEGMPGVELLQDWRWCEEEQAFRLQCRLSIQRESALVPRTTDWVVLVEPEYPWGEIRFYPSAQNGIERTFQHQSYNGPAYPGQSWRRGKLCLSSELEALRRKGFRRESRVPRLRLVEHVARAIAWLEAGASGTLALPGEPFELPPLPPTFTRDTTVFSEDAGTFSGWLDLPQRRGIVELGVATERAGSYLKADFHKREPERSSVYFVRCYKNLDGLEIARPSWGSALRDATRLTARGVWVKLDAVPVLEPWHVPSTWGELRQACRAQGIDLMEHLRACVLELRDGAHHPLLLGFPIPEFYDGAPTQIHWIALRLPILSHRRLFAKGFRPNELGYWTRDMTEVLRDDLHLEWTNTENWAPGQIATRGQLPSDLAETRVLLIGAGALGSVLAELLVRAGLRDLLVLDGDVLKGGNLTRHTLSIANVGAMKAWSLADRLNHAFPHASIEAISEAFPPGNQETRERVLACDVVIDCTASDDVAHALERFPWKKDRCFISLSVGHRARRLFCFAATGERFPAEYLLELLEPYLADERTRYADDEAPREGVGCWSPVFPARIDDVWLWAPIAVKFLESVIQQLPERPRLEVLEQRVEGGRFLGVAEVQLEVTDG